jgi:hypothetical protein
VYGVVELLKVPDRVVRYSAVITGGVSSVALSCRFSPGWLQPLRGDSSMAKKSKKKGKKKGKKKARR